MMMVSASELVPRKGILPALVTALPTTPMSTAMTMEMTTQTVAMRRESLELVVILNGHEPQQDMGHTEVAQAPGQGGDDGAGHCKLPGCAGGGVIALGQVQVAGQGPGRWPSRTSQPPAWLMPKKTTNTRATVMTMLWIRSVVDTARKPPSDRVGDDDHGTHDHGGVVIHPKEAVENSVPHGLEAGGGVGDEEDQDDHSGDAGEHVLLVPVAAGEEVWAR